ncbi:pilus assembly protein TadG-related protein [Tautonia marina]|uniref:pilus assembly protein TadG-related protein n=1 Tax=Tautonia marina TaxID=2653855 RepID=UPI0012606906|nr:pilus assembly protein TadG-related protein [Tautonia marina]
MRRHADAAEGRRGATLVLSAVMMTAILGFVALAVDTTVLAVARHQLGISADAGALAGASALADERRLNPNMSLTTIFTSAQSRAQQFVEQNEVLGQPPVIVSNPFNAPNGDVVLGYIADPMNPASPFLSDASLAANFNSVQVRAARSEERGGIVPAFFARAIGIDGASVRVRGTATAMNYSIAGFSSESSQNADLLPIVLDQEAYERMISPTSSNGDKYRYDTDTGQVASGTDGIPESVLYPVKSGSPGNWGTVNIGTTNNSTSTLGAQIRYGVTPQQLSRYPGGKLTLSQSDSDGPYVMLEGDPGISAGIKDDLTAIIGKPRTIPIYSENSGNGNNAQYKVVDFAAVRVLSVNFKGNPKYVIVQPALTRDPTAIPGEVQTNWTAGGLIRLNLSR